MEDFYQQLTGISSKDAIAKRLEIEKVKRKEEKENIKQKEQEFCEKHWPQIKQKILEASKNNLKTLEYKITVEYFPMYRSIVSFLKDKGFGVDLKRLTTDKFGGHPFLLKIDWD